MDINQGMNVVEQVMFDAMNSDVEPLKAASEHILKAGGKRIRPRIVLASYAALGGTDAAYVAPVAAAVELVHTASVVHDDINDHGVVRRGRPSINAIWGRTFALLTGDFFFTKVYELMGPYKDLNMVLAEATVALVEGETLQASAAKSGNLSREIYYRIIGLKTAALFRAGARLGGYLANATAEQIEALENYGYNIGLAFQMVDDILDLTSDDTVLGKTSGIDLTQGKGIGSVYNANGGLTTGDVAVAEDENDDDVMGAVKRKLLNGNALEEARLYARQLVQQGIEYLDVLPESEGKTNLIEIANLVVNRDH
jgi:geranylgeranyl pyrophosphate synthase